ncbi:aryl-sulfate sulfotransferase [Halosimplex rubrum]|uniref:Aryl-sulfate sulfotransferase n=1 Tax=Halosimplex rubrum TaxID=869889 RepID=A0A7D5SNL7_9EURY|nr:aryl-sulfate sulfotransferase [Halosimplex rubrum]QLH75807.1 aryl-sulfate sulfotransferase [Halosimplex rubrum]
MDLDSLELTRPLVARLCVVALVAVLLIPSGVSALTHEPVELQAGNIDEPANGTTVIAVQGFKGRGQNSSKKPARLVGVGPEGDLEWNYEPKEDVTWFYDVDPLDDGTLLVTGVTRDGTTVFKYDPATNSRVWTERLDADDTHDVDLINGDELLVANMRNYNETTETNDDRIFVYNRTTGETVWEYRFERIYDRGDTSGGSGSYTGDWTHVNDIDKIDDGRYMASPRNMDEVVVINRSTKEVDLSLGTPGNHSVIYEQHNPNYLDSEDGAPTILVADSENDRVVEYEYAGGEGRNASWERIWNLGVDGNLNWPRDADRLPSGNTLVTDSLNHRVMEVTPEGEVVWEYYAPWGTYEAERVQLGDEPGGPTIADQNASGAYGLNGSAALTPGATERATFASWLHTTFAGTPISGQVDWVAERWAHIAPWVRPVWMNPWAFVAFLGAAAVTLGWAGGEAVYHRRWIGGRLRAGYDRVRPSGGGSSRPDD